MLTVTGLVAGYQTGSRVLDGMSLSIQPGEVVALIGRNGMGKSTFLKTLTGHLTASAGRIEFLGNDIFNAAAHDIANAGIGYVPQGREIFSEFSVEQNLLMGAIGKSGIRNTVPEWAYEPFPILDERRKQRAGTMSGGQQQQLAIMRALVGQPKLLLLDEPSEGIQPSIVQEIGQTLARISRDHSLTVLLVEQNLELVFAVAQRCLFMENGGIAEEVSDMTKLGNDSAIIHKYLSV